MHMTVFSSQPHAFKALILTGTPGSEDLRFSDQLQKDFSLAWAHMHMGWDPAQVMPQGVILDMRLAPLAQIQQVKNKFESHGYEVGMLYVVTDSETPSHMRSHALMFGDQFWFKDDSSDVRRRDLVRRDIQQWLTSATKTIQALNWQLNSLPQPQMETQHMHTARKVSAGVIITDHAHILLGHVTGGSNWDIPKGGIDAGESALDAAVRELREETGLRVNPSQLKYLGKHPYSKRKDLELFLWHVDTMPDVNTLHCTSQFQHEKSKSWLPELDDFAVVPYTQSLDLVNSNLQQVLIKLDHLFPNK